MDYVRAEKSEAVAAANIGGDSKCGREQMTRAGQNSSCGGGKLASDGCWATDNEFYKCGKRAVLQGNVDRNVEITRINRKFSTRKNL